MELSLAKRTTTALSSSNYKPLMLKDLLVDDLSSCSSSGFRSYPRRQCCTTVRFLPEIDLKNKPTKQKKRNKPQPPPPLVRSPLKLESGNEGVPTSTFQRASEAIIKAVKHLPFAAFKSSCHSSSPSKLKLGGRILPRSLSRKRKFLLSFWKKNDHKEIQMWRPIIHDHTSDHDEEQKSSPPRDIIVTANSTWTSESTNSTVSWSDSDESLHTSTTANSTSTTKIIPELEKDKNVLPIDDGVVSSKRGAGADNYTDLDSNHPTTNNNSNSPNPTKSWSNEEKEQFSPVSVLDCPFEDDEEDEVSSSSSPFQNRLSRVEGTKKRLMKKIMRFELLTQLEPVNLVERIAVSESDQESNESIQDYGFLHNDDDDNIEETAEEKASEFLELLKYTLEAPLSQDDDSPANTTNNNIKPNLEKLLLDFFKLGYLDLVSENYSYSSSSRRREVAATTPRVEELLATAKDWVEGKSYSDEQVLGWKVEKNRETYIRDMERGGEWRRRIKNNLLDTKEKEEVALEIEVEIFSSLINELSDDLLLDSLV